MFTVRLPPTPERIPATGLLGAGLAEGPGVPQEGLPQVKSCVWPRQVGPSPVRA